MCIWDMESLPSTGVAASPSSWPCFLPPQAITNNKGNWSLQLELAGLLVRLRQWQPAVTVITRCLDRERQDSTGSVDNLTTDVEAWLVMAKWVV